MNKTNEAAALPNAGRRQLLIAGAAVVVVAAAGGGYYAWNRYSTSPPKPSIAEPPVGADVPMAEFMTPGPLGDESLGSANAPVTIVEYASMTCPHCAHFHETTFPELKKKYIDTGKVRFIMREFPLDQLAAAAFMLARCAGKDRYYPMIETLFATQRDWVVRAPLEPLKKIAKQAGISEQGFEDCLKDQKILDGIEQVRSRASKDFKVESTPTFFINGKALKGAAELPEFEKEMAQYLKS